MASAENVVHPVQRDTLSGHRDRPLGGDNLLPVIGPVRLAVLDLASRRFRVDARVLDALYEKSGLALRGLLRAS